MDEFNDNENITNSQNETSSVGENACDGYDNGKGYDNDNGNAVKRNKPKWKFYNTRAYTVFCIVLALVLAFSCGFFTYRWSLGGRRRTINEIVDKIEKYSIKYSGQEISEHEQFNVMIWGLTEYDAYAEYLSPENYKKFLAEFTGNNADAGFSYDENRRIVFVIGNSPSYKAGLKAGDRIVAVKERDETEYTETTSYLELYTKLGSIKTGKIMLKVERQNVDGVLEFEVEKTSYTASYVEYFDNAKRMYFTSENSSILQPKEEDCADMLLPDDTAYINFIQFTGGAGEQLEYALDYMAQRGKSKLILDIRSNGGGDVTVMQKAVSLLVKAEGRFVASKVEYSDHYEYHYADSSKYKSNVKNLVVLASSGTASASETLLGALLSYGKNEKGNGFSYNDLVLTYNSKDDRNNYSTYGKGIMQTYYNLSNGGALKLTVAKVRWPDSQNTCIQGVGIVQTIPENCVAFGNEITRAVEILNAKN